MKLHGDISHMEEAPTYVAHSVDVGDNSPTVVARMYNRGELNASDLGIQRVSRPGDSQVQMDRLRRANKTLETENKKLQSAATQLQTIRTERDKAVTAQKQAEAEAAQAKREAEQWRRQTSDLQSQLRKGIQANKAEAVWPALKAVRDLKKMAAAGVSHKQIADGLTVVENELRKQGEAPRA